MKHSDVFLWNITTKHSIRHAHPHSDHCICFVSHLWSHTVPLVWSSTSYHRLMTSKPRLNEYITKAKHTWFATNFRESTPKATKSNVAVKRLSIRLIILKIKSSGEGGVLKQQLFHFSIMFYRYMIKRATIFKPKHSWLKYRFRLRILIKINLMLGWVVMRHYKTILILLYC